VTIDKLFHAVAYRRRALCGWQSWSPRYRPDGTIFISCVTREIRAAAEQDRARETAERREKENAARMPKHIVPGLEETR
jgi:hypothetical protein